MIPKGSLDYECWCSVTSLMKLHDAGKTHMRFCLAGTLNRLNIEHQTPNIERRILMTLCFIDYIASKPQKLEVQNRCRLL